MIRDQTTPESPAIAANTTISSGLKRRHTDPGMGFDLPSMQPSIDFRDSVQQSLTEFGLPELLSKMQLDLEAVKVTQSDTMFTANNLVADLENVLSRAQSASEQQDQRMEHFQMIAQKHENSLRDQEQRMEHFQMITEKQEHSMRLMHEEQVSKHLATTNDQSILGNTCEKLYQGIQQNTNDIHKLGQNPSSSSNDNENANWWTERDQMRYLKTPAVSQGAHNSRSRSDPLFEEQNYNPYGPTNNVEERPQRHSLPVMHGPSQFGAGNSTGYGGPLNAPMISSSKIVPPPVFDGGEVFMLEERLSVLARPSLVRIRRSIALGNWFKCQCDVAPISHPLLPKCQ